MSAEESKKISFYLGKVKVFTADVRECQILAEVRPLLDQNPYLKLTPNYTFNCQNQIIKEHVLLND